MKLTIGEVNHYLDQLAGDEGNESKVKVLTQLLQVTTPNQMKWIIQILLRDLKVQSFKSCGHCYLLASCTPYLHCSELLCACLRHLRPSLMSGPNSFYNSSLSRVQRLTMCARGLSETMRGKAHPIHHATQCVLLHVTQIGLSETSVMRDYHKDALDRYNVTCDFPNVIRELIDPHKRFPFQVGAPHCLR